jgi:hypothetical protein
MDIGALRLEYTTLLTQADTIHRTAKLQGRAMTLGELGQMDALLDRMSEIRTEAELFGHTL